MNSTANIGTVQHADAELFDVIIIGAGSVRYWRRSALAA